MTKPHDDVNLGDDCIHGRPLATCAPCLLPSEVDGERCAECGRWNYHLANCTRSIGAPERSRVCWFGAPHRSAVRLELTREDVRALVHILAAGSFALREEGNRESAYVADKLHQLLTGDPS